MRPPLHQRFVDKAQAAMTAAVEVYNKPAFSYREETFAILALNAWELLVKAKLLKDADNDVRVIRVYESRETKTGKKSKKQFLRINAAGNAMTIGFIRGMMQLEADRRLPAEVALNLRALVDIRDNSVHYVTPSAMLAQLAQEVAAASVANFVLLAKRWFTRDLSRVLNLVLPLSFVVVPKDAAAVVVSADEGRLIQHLRTLGSEAADPNSEYAVAVKLQVKLEKSNLDGASKIVFSKDSDAVKVQLTDEEQYKRFPWTYDDLCAHMTKRYVDFKANSDFHALRKKLANDPRFAIVRYLDMVKKTGLRKVYFSPNILPAFDEHYSRKA
jgi:hypothetical protein